MDTRADEIAAGIHRVSVFLPQGAGGAGFTFNHFVILGDESLLFHCGLRKMFPLVSEAVAKIIPLKKLRWLSFGHFEADECGSMNEWLAASPLMRSLCMVQSVAQCRLQIWRIVHHACSLMARLSTSEASGFATLIPHTFRTGGMRVSPLKRAQRPFYAATFLRKRGGGPPLTENDIVGPAMEAEDFYALTSLGPATAPNIRKLMETKPTTLALMHGSSFRGDTVGALGALADHYEARLQKAMGR